MSNLKPSCKHHMAGIRRIGFLLALFLLCSFSFSATLPVPGTYSTIQAAINAASSGDTILVAPGIYTEKLTMKQPVTLASLFLTTGDDTYISSTIIDGGGSGGMGGFNPIISFPTSAKNGSQIVGFTIRNGEYGIEARRWFNFFHNHLYNIQRDGIDFETNSGGIVRHNLIELCGDDPIDCDGKMIAPIGDIDGDGTDDIGVIVQYNTMRNSGDDGIEIRLHTYNSSPTLKYLVSDNEIYGNDENGVQLISGYSSVTNRAFWIQRNLIYNNAFAGIGCMGGVNTKENFEGASLLEKIHIFNNTIVGNDHGITGGDNLVAVNNIIANHNKGVKNIDGNSIVAHCDIFNNGVDVENSNLNAPTIIYTDPLLAADYSLTSGSPAIDAGTATYTWQSNQVLNIPTTAYSGSAPDIGAREFLSSTGNVPDPPILLLPANLVTHVMVTPAMQWSGTADAFKLEIATDAAFSSLVFQNALINSNTFVIPAGTLAYQTQYFWRVRGSNAAGTGAWSSVFSFTTENVVGPPPVPSLISPVDGAINVSITPTLDWDGLGDTYDWQIASDAAFSILINGGSTNLTNHTISSGILVHQNSYFWRVRAKNAFGLSAWSSAAEFTTEAAPDVIPPSVPLNLISTDQSTTTIDLAWSAATDNVGIGGYNIYMGGNFIGSESSTDHIAFGLTPQTIYQFQVTAYDAAGNESGFSNTLTVSTLAPGAVISLEVTVSDMSDDAEEKKSNGNLDVSSSDLEFGKDGVKPQIVGIRFPGINIPPGSIVTNAYLQFQADETNSSTANYFICGQNIDDAPSFIKKIKNITKRDTTNISLQWSPPAWSTVGERGLNQRTPDLSALVQEMIDHANWQAGNAICFFVKGEGQRTAESFDGDANGAPMLHVDFSADGNTFPVEWLGFTASADSINGKVDLAWSTATEVNNDYFTVERSLDGVLFTSLATVPSLGNSVSPQAYQAIDSRPISGLNYYRIRQTDIDGLFTYSNTLSVRFSQEGTIIANAWPTPLQVGANLHFTITLDREDVPVSYLLINSLGQTVRHAKRSSLIGKNEITFSTEQLSPGQYVILTEWDHEVLAKRILITP